MLEVGKVVEIKENMVSVELESNDKCTGCSMANFCHIGGEARRYIEAEKLPEVKLGDKVKVEIGGGQLLRGTTLLFLIPAFSFIVGAAVGGMLGEGVFFPLISGAIFLACTFFILHLLDKKLAGKRSKIRIVAIL
ncbi:SoxR reducing system RseC family protein [Candidatus Aerophobetes bacterium]|nr:SoxR reducing system RseC family protein [Candidatus Aerophobetes bacterium]